jgi:hypothetical protein
MLEARAQLLETRDLRLGGHAGSELAQRGTQRQPTAWRRGPPRTRRAAATPVLVVRPLVGRARHKGTAHARRIEKCGELLPRICAPGLAAVCRCASKIGMTPAGASPVHANRSNLNKRECPPLGPLEHCGRRVPRGACVAREESFEPLFDVPYLVLSGHGLGCCVQQSVQQLARNEAVGGGRQRAATSQKPGARAGRRRLRKPPVGSSSLPVGSEILREFARSHAALPPATRRLQQLCSNRARAISGSRECPENGDSRWSIPPHRRKADIR